MTRPFLSFLLLIFTLTLAMACSKSPVVTSPTAPSTPTAPAATSSWTARQSGDVVEIAYGSGASYPQYAALHTNDGYFRMIYGPGSGWGTSLVLPPCFWSNGTLYQGARTTATWATEGTDLVISFSAVISTLAITGRVRLAPPGQDSLTATVSVAVSGTIVLDRRPGEAFKPLMLSSMRISSQQWDASSAFVDGRTAAIPDEGWLLTPPVMATTFGLNGGTSSWKTNAPGIEITMDRALPVTGWVTRKDDTNADNVSMWPASASGEVLQSWEYRVRAFRP
jgi:hypothetical protein